MEQLGIKMQEISSKGRGSPRNRHLTVVNYSNGAQDLARSSLAAELNGKHVGLHSVHCLT